MEYVRKVDFGPVNEYFVQTLFDHTSGAKTCRINCIKTPAGGGSPSGMHVHNFDQILYILKGTMDIEIGDKQYNCGPGSLVILPTGVRHRQWNGGGEMAIHLAFQVPLPDPNAPFSQPA